MENVDTVDGFNSRDDESDSKGRLRRRRVDGVDCIELPVMRGILVDGIVALSLSLSPYYYYTAVNSWITMIGFDWETDSYLCYRGDKGFHHHDVLLLLLLHRRGGRQISS